MRKIKHPLYCEVFKTRGKSLKQSIKDEYYNWWDKERIINSQVDVHGDFSRCGTVASLLEYARRNKNNMWLIPAKKAFRLGATL